MLQGNGIFIYQCMCCWRCVISLVIRLPLCQSVRLGLLALAISLLSAHTVFAKDERNSAQGSNTQRSTVISRQLLRPRSHGYHLGDVFEHQLRIKMARAYLPVADSLPKVGRVTDYLQLTQVTLTDSWRPNGMLYELTLRYQVVNYSDSLVGTGTPPVSLNFASKTDIYPIVVSAWGVTISPFLMSDERDKGEMPVLAASVQPAIDYKKRLFVIGLLLWLFLLSVWPLLRDLLLVPWRAARKRPFAAASIALRQKSKPLTQESYSQAFRIIHQAFDRCFGRTMMAADIDEFLRQKPAFEKIQQSVEDFYSLSDAYFFSHSGGAAHPPMNAADSHQRQQAYTKLQQLTKLFRRRERLDRRR